MTERSAERTERILRLVPVVERLARKYRRDVYDRYDDLVSEGMIGAIQAVDRWNGQGSLEGWATRRIAGQMLDFLRRDGPLSRARWKRVVDGEEQFHRTSLDRQVAVMDGPSALVDLLPDAEDDVARIVDALAVRTVLDLLGDPHGPLLRDYYLRGLTLAQIGAERGLTESRIGQLLGVARGAAYRLIEL